MTLEEAKKALMALEREMPDSVAAKAIRVIMAELKRLEAERQPY